MNEFFNNVFNLLLAISPITIAALLAAWAFWILRRRKKRQELKWKIEEMFEGHKKTT